MRNFYLLTLIALAVSLNSLFGQIQPFASIGGSGGIDECNDVVVGGGKVFSTGYITESAYFGNQILPTLAADDGYVACQNANGAYQWIYSITGPAADRGMVITYTNDGFVYVGGFYEEILSIESFTVESAGGGQDVFVAKISQAGEIQWLKTYGGEGIETITGMGSTPENDVWFAGQFFGETTFGSYINTQSSFLLSSNSILSNDAYLVKINPSGSIINGIRMYSPENDRISNLSVDAEGNLYFAIQGIQELSLGNVEIDLESQSSWVLTKLNSNAEVQWWVKLSGVNYDVKAIDATTEYVSLVGKQISSIQFSGDSLFPILTPQGAQNIFGLICHSDSGHYAGHFQEFNTNFLDIDDVSFDNQNKVWIGGRFICAFDQMTGENENALFNSIGGSDLFVARYEPESVNQRIFRQHLGSSSADEINSIYSHGLATPVIGGASSNNLFFKKLPSWTNAGVTAINNTGTFCNDPNYGFVGSVESYGNLDSYVLNVIDLNQPVLDIYSRAGQLDCTKNIRRPEIIPNTDSIFSCTPLGLSINSRFAGFFTNYSEQFRHIESNNVATIANQTGTYYARVSRAGCAISYSDSVYLNIYPQMDPPEIIVPGAQFLDVVGGIGCENKISKMLQDTLTAYSFSSPLDSTIWLFKPFNFPVYFPVNFNSDSVQLTAGGTYLFKRITPEGCKFENCLEVRNFVEYEFDPGICINGLPPITINPEFFIDGLPSDTIYPCEGKKVKFEFNDSLNYYSNLFQFAQFAEWNITGNGVQFPTISTPPSNYHPEHSYINHFNYARFSNDGWITVRIALLLPIANVVETFVFEKQIYVQMRTPDDINISFSPEEPSICPGDTLNLSFAIEPNNVPYSIFIDDLQINPDSFNFAFTKPFIFKIVFDSTYIAQTCLVPGEYIRQIGFRNTPNITTIPAGGYKCPEDQIALIPNPGTNHLWNGPSYNSYPTDTLMTYYPGNYFYRFIDTTGCPLVSKKRLVRNINAVLPDAIQLDTICGSIPAIIKLDSDTFLTWNWASPLMGSDTIKYIYNEGFYAVSVQLCQLTDTFEFFVPKGIGSAQLTLLGENPACQGDTIYLTANPQADNYSWSNGSNNDTILVTQSGNFFVTASDSLNCSFTNSISITVNSNPPEPQFILQPACPGVPNVIELAGTFPVNWSAEENSPSLGTGLSISVDVTQNNQPIGGYAFNNNTGCRSAYKDTVIWLNTLATYPSIPVERIFCAGDTLSITPENGIGTSTGIWTGPNQFNELAFNLDFVGIQSQDAGIYFYEALMDSGFCTLDEPISIELTQRFLDEAILKTTDSLCAGEELVLTAQSYSDYQYTWNGPLQSENGPILFIQSCVPEDGGMYYLTARDSNCIRIDSIPVFVSAIPPEMPTIISENEICEGDTLFLFNGDSLSTSNATISWSGSDLLQYNSENSVFIPGFTAAMNNGISLQYGILYCKSAIKTRYVVVNPLPEFNFLTDTLSFCDGQFLPIESPVEALTYAWSTGSNSPTTSAFESGIYSLTISDLNGCLYTDFVEIIARDCDLNLTSNAFSPNGDGMNDLLVFAVDGGKNYLISIFDRWGKPIKQLSGSHPTWDGTNLHGNPVDDGTYFYVIDAEMVNSLKSAFQGSVSVFK